MSRLCITIPTWNEAVVIERNLRLLFDATKRYLPEHDVMIEVADNGSTDATREIVHRMQKDISSIHLLELHEQGKGLAIRNSWVNHLRDSDVLIFMDADLAASLEALPRLIDPIVQGEADLVCGSRFVQGAHIKRNWMREAASVLYRTLQQFILKLPVKDAQCGFKAMSMKTAREVLPLCHEQGWMFDTELIAFAAKRGFRVREIPVDWIEHRDPARRSALRLFRHGWGFLAGLYRVQRNRNKMA